VRVVKAGDHGHCAKRTCPDQPLSLVGIPPHLSFLPGAQVLAFVCLVHEAEAVALGGPDVVARPL
jgi:hypothetical protein